MDGRAGTLAERVYGWIDGCLGGDIDRKFFTRKVSGVYNNSSAPIAPFLQTQWSTCLMQVQLLITDFFDTGIDDGYDNSDS